MHLGEGLVKEIVLLDGQTAAHLFCPSNLIPAPGQYLLAQAHGSDAPLPVAIFVARSTPQGFLAAPPLPSTWLPSTRLNLRGPFGRGFALPTNARHVALLAWNGFSSRLLPLIESASKQDAAVTLITDSPPNDLPLQIEIQPFSVLDDISNWADYMAIDVTRESLPEVQERFGLTKQVGIRFEAQVLVSTPMPCGGVAECGVCAVRFRNDWKLACKDGPVFPLSEII